MDEGDRRQQHAGRGRDRRADRPDDRDHALDRDAHVVGGELVLGAGVHGDAERGVVEEQIEQRAQDDGRRDHRELVVREYQRADPEHALAERRFDLEVVGAPDDAGDRAQEIAEPDRCHDDRELRVAEDRPHHHPLGQHAEQRHADHRPGKADPVIEAENADEGEGEEAAQHHQIALGEIDDLGCLVNQHEAKRDQAVNAAKRNTAHELLNEVQHRFPPRCPAILDDRLLHPAFAPLCRVC